MLAFALQLTTATYTFTCMLEKRGSEARRFDYRTFRCPKDVLSLVLVQYCRYCTRCNDFGSHVLHENDTGGTRPALVLEFEPT